MNLADSCLRGCLATLSVLVVRIALLEYSKIHEKAYMCIVCEFGGFKMYYVMRASAPSLHRESDSLICDVRPSDRLLRMREVYVEWFKGRSRSPTILLVGRAGASRRSMFIFYTTVRPFDLYTTHARGLRFKVYHKFYCQVRNINGIVHKRLCTSPA